MMKALRFKFDQNTEAKQTLIETGDAILKEDSQTDMYWGGALQGSKNRLGVLLMELRKDYSSEQGIQLITLKNN